MLDDAEVLRSAGIAGWATTLGSPSRESRHSRTMAHIGGVASITALVLYLTWRIVFTLPAGGWNLTIGWILVSFEIAPLFGLVLKAVTVWNIDSPAPPPIVALPPGIRVAVLIPTFNEPVEVLSPTVASACALQPEHETWVLDDGDRAWVAEMCQAFGARYVSRPTHEHAKAGNMNHALDLMAAEHAAGAPAIDIIAVLDCDHVPLPTFLTATLGWFDDPEVALVQGPQCFYNAGAFDDDGVTGEQGVFFNVLMPSRNVPGAGPFWCGSTSLLRVIALRDVGGIATETITEDMHTTLRLIRHGWRTVYHHQTLAVGLAPDTPDQYLLQRRRWGMGAMQILVYERLWAAKSWMSWRNFHEYLNGTLWWLEGITTLVAFFIPVVILFSGAQTSTASPQEFAVVFAIMFATRLWGSRQLMRRQIDWSTAFALRIFRIPVGLACLWWLLTRQTLTFQVTPKGGVDRRLRGTIPRVLIGLSAGVAIVLLYAVAGLLGWVPWHTSPGSTLASGAWLATAGLVLVLGTRRIRAVEYATSRRDAHRFPFHTLVEVDGLKGELLDLSLGGAAVRVPAGSMSGAGTVRLTLPGAQPVTLAIVQVAADEVGPQIDDWGFVALPTGSSAAEILSLRVLEADWSAYSTLALWLFHTPENAIPDWPTGIPAAAALSV